MDTPTPTPGALNHDGLYFLKHDSGDCTILRMKPDGLILHTVVQVADKSESVAVTLYKASKWMEVDHSQISWGFVDRFRPLEFTLYSSPRDELPPIQCSGNVTATGTLRLAEVADSRHSAHLPAETVVENEFLFMTLDEMRRGGEVV